MVDTAVVSQAAAAGKTETALVSHSHSDNYSGPHFPSICLLLPDLPLCALPNLLRPQVHDRVYDLADVVVALTHTYNQILTSMPLVHMGACADESMADRVLAKCQILSPDARSVGNKTAAAVRYLGPYRRVALEMKQRHQESLGQDFGHHHRLVLRAREVVRTEEPDV